MVSRAAEGRDMIGPIRNGGKHIVGKGGSGLRELVQPRGRAVRQLNEKADRMARAGAPFANADGSEGMLADTKDPHRYLG